MSKKRNRKRNKKKAFKNRPFYDKLVIPADIYEKIRALTLEAEGEISGFGRTSLIPGESKYFGTSVVLQQLEVFTQECNPAHTTLKKESLHELYYEVAKMDGNPEEWNFWWHSHVNMGTGFSNEDDSTMTGITAKDSNGVGGTLIALCTNKSGETTATIYKDGKRLMESLEVSFLPEVSAEALADAKKIISDKVTYVAEFDFKRILKENDYLTEGHGSINKYASKFPPKKANRFLKGIYEFIDSLKDSVGL